MVYEILNLSYSDANDGASIAALRIHLSINKLIDLTVNRMLSIYDDKFPEINSSKNLLLNLFILV